MKSLQTLQHMAEGQKTSLAAIKKVLNAHNAKVEQFEKDSGKFSREYIVENIKGAREAAMPEVRKQLDTMRETAKLAEADREFWGSKPLLFSRIPFNSDPAADATIRMRYASELAALDMPLLQLTQKNALDEKNLALVWACQMAARATAGDGDLLDLSEVEVPGQQAALDLIKACDSALAEAELIVAGMAGQSVDPVRKLEYAYRMNPDRPTTHNSPGRPRADG